MMNKSKIFEIFQKNWNLKNLEIYFFVNIEMLIVKKFFAQRTSKSCASLLVMLGQHRWPRG